MRRRLQYTFAVGLAVALGVFGAAAASTQIPDSWFLNATSFDAPGTSQPISKPDFLGSANWGSNTCLVDRFPPDKYEPNFHAVWAVLEYDTKHHIALARGWGDECSLAVFKAPQPSIKVADADLSQFHTARGLHVGSPYSQVLAVYGPPVKHGQRFVTSYSALVPAIAVNKKPVKLDQRITLVIVDGYVSSISVYIAQSGLF
jgi:hypothetical protein